MQHDAADDYCNAIVLSVTTAAGSNESCALLYPAQVGSGPRPVAGNVPYSSSVVGVMAIGFDAAAIVATGMLSGWGYQALGPGRFEPSVFFAISVLVALVFVLSMRTRDLYDTGSLLRLDRQIKWATACWLVAFAAMICFVFLMKASADLSRGAGMLFAGGGYLVLLINRLLWRFGLARALAAGAIRRRSVAVLTTGRWAPGASEFAVLDSCGLKAVEQFVIADVGCDRSRDEALRRLVSTVRGSAIEEIVIALPSKDLHQLELLVEGLHAVPLPVRLLPDSPLSRIALQPTRSAGNRVLVDIKREPLSALERTAKRALDVTIATSALIVLAPLLGLAMLAIKIDTQGPVLFRQTRRGFNGRTFKILKLRSMSVMEDGAGVMQATRSDPRVTRVGFWLRRTSIDELPQLWNVLRGEMSVIGPRPHAVAHDNFYDQIIENYAFRQHVKPGLTGWAQVRGLRGETPEVSLMEARVDHDVWYIHNWTLVLDLRILVLTCVKLFAKTAY